MVRLRLIRHGKVKTDYHTPLSALEFPEWVASYDDAPLDLDHLPPSSLHSGLSDADWVISSTLRRSIDSASFLGLQVSETNALFNEASVPEPRYFPRWMRLQPQTWLRILRLFMIMGIGREDKVYREAKMQADEAARRIRQLGENYREIVVIGHGGMNWLIAGALKTQGWSAVGKASRHNWGETVLRWRGV